jgi:hypothetical protein
MIPTPTRPARQVSAPIEHHVHFSGVRFVVDHSPCDFDPGVGFENERVEALTDRMSFLCEQLQLPV